MILAMADERLLSSEGDLLRCAAKGDVAAFEQLIRQQERPVLRLAWRLTGSLPDAQDIAQEAFLKFHERLGQFQDQSQLSAWFYRVTVNLCWDLARKKKSSRLVVVVDNFNHYPSSTPNPEESTRDRQYQELVNSALLQLPERERAAIVLREMEGLSTAEVASVLGSAEATVRVQICTARVKLRKIMKQMGGVR